MDEPATVTLAVCTDQLYGPNLAAIVAVLGPMVDHLFLIDHRSVPEATHTGHRAHLVAWAKDHGYPLTASWLPNAELSDCWNLAAVRAETVADGAPWTLVLWDAEGHADPDVLAQLIEAVEDYDVAIAARAIATGWPSGVQLTLCQDVHATAPDCLADLLSRIPDERRHAITD